MNEAFNFNHQLTVRWSEIDSMKFVYNAHYLTYLDIASTEYFKECLKHDLLNLIERDAFDFVLVKSTLEFNSPARLWDQLRIWCRTKSIGHSSFTMEFIITKDDMAESLLTAEIIYANFNKEQNKAVPIPDFIRKEIQEFEEGNSRI